MTSFIASSTIAAIATALSPSGIGIVRISGPDSVSIADRIFHPKKEGKTLSSSPTYTIHYGWIYDGEELIDEVLVMLMRAPGSYTGEDTVEIDCHGGVYVLRRILQTVLKNGAVLAEPGEFSKRAFLNGRMDLTQAEAVIDLIESKNQYAASSSIRQVSGQISSQIKELRAEILYEAAFLESALDDPEHISLDGFAEELAGKVGSWAKKCEQLAAGSRNRRILFDGIRTVILGKPNVGKSSLLNLLLGEDRAIVTDVAGTTRDTLEEQIVMDDVLLTIVDTAGIRDTVDEVERIGVERAKRQAADADLVLFVVDGSEGLTEEDELCLKEISDKQVIVICNKQDLSQLISAEELAARTHQVVIPLSARTGEGKAELSQEICRRFYEGKISMDDDSYLANERHRQAFEETVRSLKLVKQSIEDGMPEDFFSVDLMNAYENLGKVIGESVGEDLINEIFGRFCMGK